MIARRNFFRTLLGGVFAWVSVPGAVRAAPRKRRTAAPSPTPSPEPAKVLEENPPVQKSGGARLRLWKVNDAPERSLQIRLLSPGKSDADAISPLKIEPEAYQFSGYVDVPAGPTIAEVSASERTTVHLPLLLADGEQYTLLVRAQGTSLTADEINDTPSPADNGCDFRIFNLLPASGDIQVDLGSILTVHLSSTRSSLRLNGIKRASYPVTINGYDGNGKNFRWNTDADFRQYRKAALLIFPDAYGRIRPRINWT